MSVIPPLDDLINLARLSQSAYDKPLKFMDDKDDALIKQFRNTFTPALVEQLCLQLQLLENARQNKGH